MLNDLDYEAKHSFEFWKNLFLVVVFFTITPITLGFLNFPNELLVPEGVGKVVLECHGTGNNLIQLDLSGGVTYKKNNWDPSWPANSFIVDSERLILEIWSYGRTTHGTLTFYIKNVGVFS
jgi:archaellum component FlaG (FlaF/FlaG flagellin family)